MFPSVSKCTEAKVQGTKNNLLSRLSLMSRIKIAFAAILIISAFTTVLALIRFTNFSSGIRLYTEQLLPTNTRTGELRAYLNAYRLAEAQFIMAEDDKSRTDASDAIDTAGGNLFIYGKTLAEGLTDNTSIKLYESFTESWSKYTEGTDKIKALITAKKAAEANALFFGEHAKIYDSCAGSFNDLANETFKRGETEGSALLERVKQDSRILKIALALILISGFGLSYNVIKSARRVLVVVSDNMSQAARDMRRQADVLSATSGELKDKVNGGAAAMTQTMTALTELNSTIERNSELSSETRDMAQKSSGEVQNGETFISKLSELTKAVGDGNKVLAETIHTGNIRMSEILKMIESIGDKTKIINDIGFQTKILSFNASVEAALAGEHGRGLSIVAEEVGTLASTSGKAAKEIDELLKSTIDGVREAIHQSQSEVGKALQSTSELVDNSAKMTTQCETIFKAVASTVKTVAENIDQIAIASTEQSQALKSITTALEDIESVTQKSALASDETLSCSQKVSENIDSMTNMVHDLMVSFQGRAGKTNAEATEDAIAS
jgi:methyl-accepting chemotaxis protein